MRRARVTYSGAFHHVMSRGHQGNPVFQDPTDKNVLLNIWRKFSSRNGIVILAWCILDNHYHLILFNPDNTLSRFMKESNGTYGIHFRSVHGGRGSVFDGRFKSTVIEKDQYLASSILYLLQNPVRAGLVDHPGKYNWCSFMEMLSPGPLAVTGFAALSSYLPADREFAEAFLAGSPPEIISVFRDRWGETFGSHVHRFHALHKGNRRQGNAFEVDSGVRAGDSRQGNPNDVIARFLTEHGLTLDDLRERNWQVSRLRGELLVQLRDECGLKLSEIHRLAPFRHLRRGSLGSIYQNSLLRRKESQS